MLQTTVVTTAVVQTVSFTTIFTVPSTGVPATTRASDSNGNFTAAYAAYGTAAALGSWNGTSYTFTPNAGMALKAGNSRRAQAVAFTSTIQTCTGVCSGTYASTAAASNLQSLTGNSTALASTIATAASAIVTTIPGATQITAPTVQNATVSNTTVTTTPAPAPGTNDSGKSAVVAVTSFATAIIAMMM